MSTRSIATATRVKALVLTAAALPALWFCVLIARELESPGSGFGPDGAEAATAYLGDWALRLLIVTLAVSPLRRRFGWPLAASRRGLGLATFGYALAHLTIYFVGLAGGDWRTLIEDVVERPYITVGAAALLILLPLAVTSTRGWQRRLKRRWLTLHRWVYVAAALAMVHLIWLTRDGYGEVVLYLALLLALAVERLSPPRRAAASAGR